MITDRGRPSPPGLAARRRGSLVPPRGTSLPRWRSCLLLGVVAAGILLGCTTIPNRYVKQAEAGVTLSALVSDPQRYEGKVVILGGAIAEAVPTSGWVWVRMKNRPLDQDYRPHRPASLEGPETGYFWVTVGRQAFPTASERWMRVTVVGRVMPPPRPREAPDTHGEPVLGALYLKGWGDQGARQDSWEQHIDPNYVPSMPGEVRIE